MVTESRMITFSDLPPVNSNIFGIVAARNVFGSGEHSIQAEGEIGMFLLTIFCAYICMYTYKIH